MKKLEWIFRVILPAFISVFIIIFLFNEFKAYQFNNAMEKQHLMQLRYEIQELDVQKNELQDELREIKESYSRKSKKEYTITPIIMLSDEYAVYDIKEVMDKYRWNGTIGLSLDMIPGENEYLSKESYDRLIEGGWRSCLYWNGDNRLEDYLYMMKNILNNSGVEWPNTIIFEKGFYSDDYDELIENYKIENIVYYSNESVNSLLPQMSDNGLRKIICCNWDRSEFDSFMSINEKQGGMFCIAYDMNNAEIEDNYKELDNFLEYLYGTSKNDTMCKVGTIEEAIGTMEKENSTVYLSEREKQDYETQISELEKRIQEIEERRQSLFNTDKRTSGD